MRTTIKFSQIPESLKYPANIKASLSTAHSNLITEASKNFIGSLKNRRELIEAINTVSYMYVSGDTIPLGWSPYRPMEGLPEVDEDVLKSTLGDLYLQETSVNFDIPRTVSTSDIEPTPVAQNSLRTPVVEVAKVEVANPTSKVDLYIQPPVVPKFDVHKFQEVQAEAGTRYGIYTSLPLIPTKQNEISATTNVDLMQESDLRKLYPTCVIRTRSENMYAPCDGVKLHPVLGLILPIKGFTEKQVIDNIVRYPHLFRLQKQVADRVVSFYSTVEIDGDLISISDAWNSLPDTKNLPYNNEFVKEYVVRRYLLERDIKKIDHRYKLYGTLDQFLTLFAPADTYIDLGYTDIVGIARQCVLSRVSYKRSRNPVLRRLENV